MTAPQDAVPLQSPPASAPALAHVEPQPRPVDWARMLFLVTLWGSSFALVELTLETLSPAVIVMLRMWIGASALLLIAAIARSPLPRIFPRPDPAWIWLAGVGLVGNTVPFFLIPWAQQTTTSGMTAIVLTSSPLFVALLGHFVVKEERLTARRLLGLLIAFAGVGVLFAPALFSDERGQAAAILALLGAAFLYANTAIIARYNTHRPMVGGAAAVCLVAALATTPFVLWDIFAHGLEFTPRSGAAMIALGIFPTAIATIVYMATARSAGPGFLTLTNYLVPLFSVALGTALLHERLDPRAFVALAMILTGVLLAGRKRRKA